SDILTSQFPYFEDPIDLVNAVISVLATPEEVTNVSLNFANDKNSASEVQAYAKISGNSWTYYVKQLSVSIGRNTESAVGPANVDLVDIDLGPAKVVSRAHAAINYNLSTRVWELVVSGRNGAKVDGNRVGINEPTALHSGAIVDIGSTQMMFILPDLTPTIAPPVLAQLAPRLGPPHKKTANSMRSGMMKGNHYNPLLMKGFQLFAKGNAAANTSSIDQDLSRDESKDTKPPYSYATMITQSILSNPEGALSLSEIYEWISSRYAFYRHSKTGWQNSIRHNLSLNKAFEKVPRKPNEPGKGMKWQISDSYKEEFLNKLEDGSLSKARRGSSVSRQLQLHLSNHNHLPGEKK
ncbi:hypothetical protein BABINDRAFT_29220, partial [Babjeviella inositovora NRRL Y-12698]